MGIDGGGLGMHWTETCWERRKFLQLRFGALAGLPQRSPELFTLSTSMFETGVLLTEVRDL